MGKSSLLAKLALCATFFALTVVALGAFTRLIDAGLGCPDWPGCYGQIAVSLISDAQQLTANYPGSPLVLYKAWAEMIHRYFVGGLSLFILSIVFIIFKKYTQKKLIHPRGNIILAMSLLLLTAYQIMLGRWTVTLKLLPIIVSQHLICGFLLLATLWLVYLNNRTYLQKRRDVARRFLPWSIIACILLLLQISLGAWTSTNYASLSCPDFPFCLNDNPFMPLHLKVAFNFFVPIGVNYEGGVLPEVVRQTIQIMHRLGALILASYYFIFIAIAMIQLRKFPDVLKTMYLALAILFIQLSIGIANVIFKLPLITALSHNLFAVILLLVMVTLTFKLAFVSVRYE